MICDSCGKDHFDIVQGWESDKALMCPNCGQYHYWVFGRIHCALTVGSNYEDFDEKEAKKLLGIPEGMGE